MCVCVGVGVGNGMYMDMISVVGVRSLVGVSVGVIVCVYMFPNVVLDL